MTSFPIVNKTYFPSAINIAAALGITITAIQENSGTVYVEPELTAGQVETLRLALENGTGADVFRGALVLNSVDVDNKVSADIKESIAPGRPANLQAEAEKALLAKICSLTAKTALGMALSAEEQAYLGEKLTFYAATVQVIRDEGNAFITARGW